jgi:hypothetical protein
MATVYINNGAIELRLTSARSRVRICDINGNHVSKPSSQNINFNNHYIEWMITNNELLTIIKQKFGEDEVTQLKNELEEINISLRDSGYNIRAAQKENTNRVIEDFLVYKYEEIYYSFEKDIDTNLKVKITFKMGDYTLAAHMFVLINLTNSNIELRNNEGILENTNILGSGARCIWNPTNLIVREITKTLAYSSGNHRNDLVTLLNNIRY